MNLFIIEIAAATAGGFALLASVGGELTEDQIFAYCAFGSVFGSLGHIFRVKLYEQDGVIFTFLLNAFIAYFVGSPLCDVLPLVGLRENGRNCAALAFAIAFSAPWLVSTIFPIVGKKLAGTVRKTNFRAFMARMLNIPLNDPK